MIASAQSITIARRPRRSSGPDRFAPYLGSTLFKRLNSPVLIIGRDTWTRSELAQRLGLTNTHAATRLTKIAADLQVKSTADLYHRTTPYTFSDPDYRAGVTTLLVMFRAFEAKGLTVSAWYVGKKGALPVFAGFKRQERAATQRTKGAQ